MAQPVMEQPNLKGEKKGTTNTLIWTDDDGKYHRDNGPAFMFLLYDIWFRHGVEHRDDGPSMVWTQKYKHHHNQWHINGHDITGEVEEWLAANNISWPFNEEETVMFKLRFA
jgi:hypothetical protein